MAISTKSSVFGVMKETTEGTYLVPAASTDYVALRPDAAMAPSIETLENEEVKSSIGASQPILGNEAPTYSVSHYIKHSGVEGQAPAYGKFLESLFGAVDTEATQYDTVSSSTTSVIKVDTGEGAQFRRGQALLIKDSTNGYRIRAVESISSDDLTLMFRLPSAPSSGVNLGKATTYYPANSGHPTLSLTHYLGNGGAIQAMTGARVVSASITGESGALLDGSFSMEGNGYYLNPIIITSSTEVLDFLDDATTRAVSVDVKTYKCPEDLAAALETAMNAAGSSNTFTVSFSKTTGKFTIASSGTTLSLLWNTGANAASSIGTKLGFLVAANDTGALTYTSDNAITLTAPHTPSYDSSNPVAVKNQEVMVGSVSDYLCFAASSFEFSVESPKTNILSICAESGISSSVVNERTVTVTVSGYLTQYDSDIFYKFIKGQNVKFQYSFGEKVGGNWVAGKCGCISLPTATVSSYEVTDVDGVVGLNLTLTGYVNASGEGECFISFV